MHRAAQPPAGFLALGGLHAACRCIHAHMHGQTDGCPLHLTIQFRLSFNPVTLADEGWGSAGIGQHAAGGASVGMGGTWLDPGAPNCAWRWGRGREHKHGGMEGVREGAGQARVEEESEGLVGAQVVGETGSGNGWTSTEQGGFLCGCPAPAQREWGWEWGLGEGHLYG